MKNLAMLGVLVEAVMTREEIKGVIKANFQKLKKLLGMSADQFTKLRTIGSGEHGTAIDLGNGRVLKITNDQKEAATANFLVGKGERVPKVVKFYNVFKFPESDYYGIVQEKLEPVSEEEVKEFNGALVKTGLPVWMKRNPKASWDTLESECEKYMVKKASEKGVPESQTAREVAAYMKKLELKYDLKDMHEALVDLGISFHDYHAGNLMKRPDGSYALIDLGISSMSGESSSIKSLGESRKRVVYEIVMGD